MLIEERKAPGSVLDLGAGLGNNAMFLAKNGFDVTAVEISAAAVELFKARLSNEDSSVIQRVRVLHQDALDFVPDRQFDSVLAYGLLHCLQRVDHVQLLLRRMQLWTNDDGHHVVVALTNRLPVPAVQAYLEPIVVSEELLRNCYGRWSFRSFEHTVLTESHPTSRQEHDHSICRLLARKTTQ
jgi:cyclopropane fatty-acyl-phospholipid synthase-like methyltransferase